MAIRELTICSAVRAAACTYGEDMPAIDTGAAILRAALDRARSSPDCVDTVGMGSVIQAGNKMGSARQATILAARRIMFRQ